MSAFYNKGRYWVEVIDQALGASKAKGTPQFVLKVSILGTVNEDEPDKYDACQPGDRSIYLYFTPKSAEYALQDLQSIGFDKTSMKYLSPETPGYHNFNGTTFIAECRHEEYNGDSQEKWQIAGDRGLSIEPLDPAKVRELDSLFGSALKAKAKKPAAKPADKPVSDPATAPLNDPNTSLQEAAAAAGGDDIPF
jgi:hypothetical protein